MIKISSKFGIRYYVHNGEAIKFRRIYGGIGWPSHLPGCAIIIGEENWQDQTKYFLLAEIHADSIPGLIKSLQEFHKRNRKKIPVDDWFGRQTPTTDSILGQHNTKAFHARSPQFFVSDATSCGDVITGHIETIRETLDPNRKKLYLFNESQVQAAMQGVPDDISKYKNVDNPIVAALGYALTALVEFPFYDRGDIVLPANRY